MAIEVTTKSKSAKKKKRKKKISILWEATKNNSKLLGFRDIRGVIVKPKCWSRFKTNVLFEVPYQFNL